MPRWQTLPLRQAVLPCEAEKASLISDCSKEGGSFEYWYLGNLLSQKEHVVDPIFYLDILQEPRAGLFLKPNILSLLPIPGWSFLDRGQKRLPFHSNLPNEISSPCAQRLFSLTQKQTLLLTAESGFKPRSFWLWRCSLWLSRHCRLSRISAACTFWPNCPKPGLHLLTPRFCGAHQTGGDSWSHMTALTDTGQKEKWGLGHFCFFYFNSNLNLPSSKASSAFEPKLF